MTKRYTVGPQYGGDMFCVLNHLAITNAIATKIAIINMSDSCVITGGEFYDGEFHGGTFTGGDYYGGHFYGGVFRDGYFFDGTYYSGEFFCDSGYYSNGEFHARRKNGTSELDSMGCGTRLYSGVDEYG